MEKVYRLGCSRLHRRRCKLSVKHYNCLFLSLVRDVRERDSRTSVRECRREIVVVGDVERVIEHKPDGANLQASSATSSLAHERGGMIHVSVTKAHHHHHYHHHHHHHHHIRTRGSVHSTFRVTHVNRCLEMKKENDVCYTYAILTPHAHTVGRKKTRTQFTGSQVSKTRSKQYSKNALQWPLNIASKQ